MATAQPDTTRTLDVRTIDGEPFGDILAALESLPETESLCLINTFEPEPLYPVLEARGFTYERMTDDGIWYVVIRHA